MDKKGRGSPELQPNPMLPLGAVVANSYGCILLIQAGARGSLGEGEVCPLLLSKGSRLPMELLDLCQLFCCCKREGLCVWSHGLTWRIESGSKGCLPCSATPYPVTPSFATWNLALHNNACGFHTRSTSVHTRCTVMMWAITFMNSSVNFNPCGVYNYTFAPVCLARRN